MVHQVHDSRWGRRRFEGPEREGGVSAQGGSASVTLFYLIWGGGMQVKKKDYEIIRSLKLKTRSLQNGFLENLNIILAQSSSNLILESSYLRRCFFAKCIFGKYI